MNHVTLKLPVLIFGALITALGGIACTDHGFSGGGYVDSATAQNAADDSSSVGDTANGATADSVDTAIADTTIVTDSNGLAADAADSGLDTASGLDTITNTDADTAQDTLNDTSEDTGVYTDTDNIKTTDDDTDLQADTDNICEGCAVLSVPFTDFGSTQIFTVYMPVLTDFSGATMKARIRALSAGDGGIQIVAQNDEINGYAAIGYGAWYGFADSMAWTDVDIDIDALSAAATNGFDKTAVFGISILLSAGAASSGGELSNPSVVLIDFITVTDELGNDIIPPMTFDKASDVRVVTVNDFEKIEGSSVGYQGTDTDTGAGNDTDTDTGTDPNIDSDIDTGTDTSVDTESGTDVSTDEQNDTDATTAFGYAVLNVPFISFDTSQIFSIYFTPRLDFSGAEVVVRLKALTQGEGGVQVVVQNDDSNGYAAIGYGGWYGFANTQDWVDVTLDIDTLAGNDTGGFDKAQVFAISLIMSAGDGSGGGELTNPSIVYIDSITVHDDTTNIITPITFDTEAEIAQISVNEYNGVPGSTVTYLDENTIVDTDTDTGTGVGTDTDTLQDTDVDTSTESDTGESETCPGCAVLSVPFTDFNTSQIYSMYLPELTDFTGASVIVRIRAKEAGAGGIQVVVQNGSENSYAAIGFGSWYSFSGALDWVDVTMDVDTLADSAGNGFDKSQVFAISVVVSAGDGSGTEALNNPSVVYVDAITVNNGTTDVITPNTFDVESDIYAISINTGSGVDGSTVSHIAE